MKTIILILLLIIFTCIIFALIAKIIGDIPHYLDYKQDHTHNNEED